MKAVQKIRSLWHQPAGDNPFKAPDRATLSVMRERAEKIEEARGRGPIEAGSVYKSFSDLCIGLFFRG